MKRAALARTALALAVAGAVLTPTAAHAARPVWAHAGFRPCVTEDADGPCYWDARTMGNGYGTSFWVDAKQRVHYLPR